MITRTKERHRKEKQEQKRLGGRKRTMIFIQKILIVAMTMEGVR